jgi:phosphatidylglycerophosphatase A
VCMDETAGTLLALIGLQGWPWVVALVVARLADIFKVLPGVHRAEALPGALGVTADNLAAGLYGLAAGWLLAILL